MKQAIADVRDFHERFGVPAQPTPGFVAAHRIELRHRLIDEEFNELSESLDALGSVMEDHETSRVALEDVADGIADLIYVCIGTALELGIPLDRVWEEVHAANMRKVGGPVRGDGKIGKPVRWVGPNIAAAIWGKP
jgi:predicted HAD superfamily Cof-like phosphohydrolase